MATITHLTISVEQAKKLIAEFNDLFAGNEEGNHASLSENQKTELFTAIPFLNEKNVTETNPTDIILTYDVADFNALINNLNPSDKLKLRLQCLGARIEEEQDSLCINNKTESSVSITTDMLQSFTNRSNKLTENQNSLLNTEYREAFTKLNEKTHAKENNPFSNNAESLREYQHFTQELLSLLDGQGAGTFSRTCYSTNFFGHKNCPQSYVYHDIIPKDNPSIRYISTEIELNKQFFEKTVNAFIKDDETLKTKLMTFPNKLETAINTSTLERKQLPERREASLNQTKNSNDAHFLLKCLAATAMVGGAVVCVIAMVLAQPIAALAGLVVASAGATYLLRNGLFSNSAKSNEDEPTLDEVAPLSLTPNKAAKIAA